jgi:hypothetical protein
MGNTCLQETCVLKVLGEVPSLTGKPFESGCSQYCYAKNKVLVIKFSKHESKHLNIEVSVLLIINAVSVATGYGLDGPGNESQWERDFPHS